MADAAFDGGDAAIRWRTADGMGGTLAAGCNVGNALTGLSVLAVNSIIATAAMFVGGGMMSHGSFVTRGVVISAERPSTKGAS